MIMSYSKITLAADVNNFINFDEVSRVEVIGDNGRLLSLWNVEDVQAQIQDNGGTLKVFLKGDK